METFATIVDQFKSRCETDAKRDPALICKAGLYGACPVFKLQKQAWTNDDMGTVPNQTGVFFSIWVDAKSAAMQRILYNIHALKMRKLMKCRITSIRFAADFRARFAPLQADWPNVSVDYGPQTLMQGWIAINDDRIERDLMGLVERFDRVVPIIDQLLQQGASERPGKRLEPQMHTDQHG